MTNFENNLIKELAELIIIPPSFKKNKLTWGTQKSPIQYLFSLQPSKSNSPSSQSFTINVGVFIPDVFKLCWQKKIPKKISESDCILRKRISYFTGQKTDKWWTLKGINDIEDTSLEINNLLVSKILPFFYSMSDFQSLSEFLMSDNSIDTKYPLYKIQLACLYILMDKKPDAISLLNKIKDDPTWGENANKVLAII